MIRSLKGRVAATMLAGAALAVTAGPAAAVTPTTDTWTNHVEIGFIDCDGFTVVGVWNIHHKLTFFYNAAGVAIRDIEQIDFSGQLIKMAAALRVLAGKLDGTAAP